jgi:uncharacterized protein with PIN domain
VIVDASAILAILLDEPDKDDLSRAITGRSLDDKKA